MGARGVVLLLVVDAMPVFRQRQKNFRARITLYGGGRVVFGVEVFRLRPTPSRPVVPVRLGHRLDDDADDDGGGDAAQCHSAE